MRRTISIIFLLLISTFSFTFSQVVIKEKVELKPVKSTQLFTDDPKEPFFLRYGGDFILYYINWDFYHPYELWEETLGHLEGGNLPAYDSLYINHFHQWKRFDFFMYNPSTENTVYNEVSSGWFLGNDYDSFYSLTELDFNTSNPPHPWMPDYMFIAELDIDSSDIQPPPQEVLDVLGDPQTPNGDITVPVSGFIYAKITYAKRGYNSDLYSGIPSDTLLKANLNNYIGDTVKIGRRNTGDKIRLYIRAPNPIYGSNKLYPKLSNVNNQFQMEDGELYLGTINFEDWADLSFTDISVDLYMHPDTISSFKSSVSVSFDPTEISPGDTAKIILTERKEDGTLVSFDPGEEFDVEIFKGQQYGTLYSSQFSDTSDGFYGVQTETKFIAADSIKGDSARVIVKVKAYSGGIIAASIKSGQGKVKQKPNEATIQGSTINAKIPKSKNKTVVSRIKTMLSMNNGNDKLKQVSVADPGNIGFGELSIKKYTIILGETKYYQAKYNAQENKLKIEEIKPDANGVPQQKTGTENGWQWLTDNTVWGDNPVSIDKGKNYGKRMGVYCETDKPVWKYSYSIKNGKENFTKKQVCTLSAGIIRLIGRYWTKDSTYAVMLKAKSNKGDSALIKIKVIKPSALGTSYPTAKDDSSHDYNVDSLCITKGGELGIPPQFLKGQMRRETSSNHPFNPTYLYEPWTTQFNAFIDKPELTNNVYFVPDDATDFNPTIINYTNVRDYHYPISPVSVWYMVESYSTIVDLTSGYTKYGKRNADGSLSFVYRIPKLKFKELQDDAFKKYHVKIHSENTQKANNEARENFINFYKNEWNGGITNGNKGLINIKAQTRMAASYGLLQILYTTAIGDDVGYPVNSDNPPEKLLNTGNLKWSLKHLTYYLNTALKNEANKNANWRLGFESKFESQIYHYWNKRTDYPTEVLTMSNCWYKPIKKGN